MKFVLHPATVFLLSVLFGGALGFYRKSSWLALVGPPAVVIGLIAYVEFVLPYEGGGASFWPIAMVISGGLALIGAITGNVVGTLLGKTL